MEQPTKHEQGSPGLSAHEAIKPSRAPDPAASGPLASFETWLYGVMVAKAPFQIPKSVKEWMVKYGPWITLAAAVLMALFVLPSIMGALAIAGYSATYGGMYGVTVGNLIGPMFYIALFVFVVQLVIMLVSIPMLLKRQRKGWLLVFYSSIIGLVYTLFNTFSYGYFSFSALLGGLIGATIGMYVIFQIRSYYKN